MFIGFFGVVAIPRLPDGMKTRFLLVFLFLAGLLLAAAFSSILLLALGGFFRIAKKHRLRYALVMAERQRFAAANAIEMGERDSSAEASLFDLSGAPTYEPQRVTEATTRDFGEK